MKVNLGDTGFCNEEFLKIGNSLGPFDLAAIPIGCYLPRWFMKSQHINPKEAVEIHTLSKAKLSLAIHWYSFSNDCYFKSVAYSRGTYEMGSNEHYLDPPKRLRKALKEKGLSSDEFIILNHGTCFSVEDPIISKSEYSDLSDTSS
ncbi:beta-lactamase superfamily domain-containing protein [Ditylenchus destructor]|uniref:Beta-lactamase superfamily domain-containing protein n=1 Tax=Ditylenchus destructor TaxID=166010 RepID=A0AAD4NJP5_9BILA|nr:beta-lactamase superfamily domain-containing protein [Ditylenchus destructor]